MTIYSLEGRSACELQFYEIHSLDRDFLQGLASTDYLFRRVAKLDFTGLTGVGINTALRLLVCISFQLHRFQLLYSEFVQKLSKSLFAAMCMRLLKLTSKCDIA